MALHDFFCGQCGQVLVDIHVPVAIGATAGAPEHCGAKTTPIPAVGSMDIGAVKTAGFHGFETTDGRGNPVLVDSLHKLRQVERESEQAYRNGEGQPMVWRKWAQDGSNADQPTLSKSYYGGDAPTPEAKHRFGSTLKKATEEPGHSYGPGVSDANTSALGGEE
jgi:hypothetical protein